MKTTSKDAVMIVEHTRNHLASHNWLKEDPEWRVSVSLSDAIEMIPAGTKTSERMQFETYETVFLATLERVLQMKLSVHVNTFWDSGWQIPDRLYQEIYKLADLHNVPVITKGKVPAYSAVVPYGKAYVPDTSLPKAVWVDVDGTLAKMADRSPFDWKRVGEDEPILHIIEIVQALRASGYKIVIMSGRDAVCEGITADWLRKHGVEFDAIHLRPAGDDKTPDNVLKHDLFWEHVADKFYVQFALDDRDKVVSFTRDVLKIPVLQVAPGNF